MLYARAMLEPPLILEMEDLLQDYYATTVANDGIPPYDFDWRTYTNAALNDKLLVAVAREAADIAMCGFVLYFVTHHLHHRTMIVATCDTLAVHRNKRGKGVGSGLMRFCEPILLDRGVERIVHTYRTVYNTTPLFEKHGYNAEETVYIKDTH